MLSCTGVSFAYRPTAPRVVDGVSMAVARGDLVGILGPNGSGKTTLLKLLAGTLTPLAGAVQLDGQPLAARSRRELARHRVRPEWIRAVRLHRAPISCDGPLSHLGTRFPSKARRISRSRAGPRGDRQRHSSRDPSGR
jgi:ABC-type dipeptide/oligopeptide/nickel transport system ATPase subunit